STLLFLISYFRHHQSLHSFPTRRSSDLVMLSVYVSAGVQFLLYCTVFQPLLGPQQCAATVPKACANCSWSAATCFASSGKIEVPWRVSSSSDTISALTSSRSVSWVI